MLRPRLFACLVSAVLLLGSGGCGGGEQRPESSGGFAGAAFPPGLRGKDFVFTTRDGRTISLAAMRGRVTVLAFLSSHAADATLAAQQIRGALDELGGRAGDVAVLLLASPEGAAHRGLLNATALGGRAQYVIGPRAQLRAAWRAYGIVSPSVGRSAFLASPTIVLLDRRGFERVGFALEQLTPEGLAHDIDTLLVR